MAARGFVLSLDEAVTAVLEAPERWPLHRHGARRYVFPNQYPYSLVYRILSSGEIGVVAVANDARRPDYWKKR